MKVPKYILSEKKIGETPLQALERIRRTRPGLERVALAYAGRLDPMASGKLLILIGDECKNQKQYHAFDKEYEFEVLFGVRSDTGDVLGLVEACDPPEVDEADLRRVANNLKGTIELSYPHFSSKTVGGKPLHTWTLEGRLNEIEIPTYTAHIYELVPIDLTFHSKERMYNTVTTKIETIPEVTEPGKALGNNFRRPDIRVSWKTFHGTRTQEQYQVAVFRCVCSAGTYMRTLAEVIAAHLGTCGLAYSIHRTKIGRYRTFPFIGARFVQKF